MGCLDKMIAFSILIMLIIMACDFVVMLLQELGRPFFLEDAFGLTLMLSERKEMYRIVPIRWAKV
jgi:branched-subunit amino acid transport protein AzlD